ncbi:MAG TPA: hypothetical protein VIY51_17635 [Xanthobacteraceae bacterium]
MDGELISGERSLSTFKRRALGIEASPKMLTIADEVDRITVRIAALRRSPLT